VNRLAHNYTSVMEAVRLMSSECKEEMHPGATVGGDTDLFKNNESHSIEVYHSRPLLSTQSSVERDNIDMRTPINIQTVIALVDNICEESDEVDNTEDRGEEDVPKRLTSKELNILVPMTKQYRKNNGDIEWGDVIREWRIVAVEKE
jgi:hypothetical protein